MTQRIFNHKGTIVSIFFLGTLAFSICLWLAVNLYELGVFGQNDVLFDTDPGCGLPGLAHGWCSMGSRNITHPNFANFFNPPVRIVGLLSSPFFIEMEIVQLRTLIALLVLPAAAALQTVLMFLTTRNLGFSRFQATLVSLLAISTLSQLIHGSIPEHFGITSCILAAAFWLMSKLLSEQRKEVPYAWCTIQVLAIGVTITNFIPIGIIHFFTLIGSGFKFWPSVYKAGLAIVLSIFVTYIAYVSINNIYSDLDSERDVVRFIEKFWVKDHLKRAVEFPTALSNTFVSPKPMLVVNKRAVERERPIQISFTLENTPRIFDGNNWLGLFVFSLLLLGSASLMLSGGTRKIVGLAALSVIIFNFCFHTFWGGELFLYSAHWLVPTIILMSGVFGIYKIPPILMNTFISGFIVVISLINASNIFYILHILENMSS